MFLVPLFALALWGFALVPRPAAVLIALQLAYATLAAMVFAGATRYRVPWDPLLGVLAGAAVDRLLRSQSAAVDRVEPLGGPLLRECLERAAAAGRAQLGGALRVGGDHDQRRPERLEVVRRHEQPRLARDDELRQPADARGDDCPAALHRLERHHPEALAARGDDDRERPLVAGAIGATGPRKRTVSSRPSAPARRRSSSSSGPAPARSSVRPGPPCGPRRRRGGACRAP